MNIKTINKKQVKLKEATKPAQIIAAAVDTTVATLPALVKSNLELIATDWKNPISFGGQPILCNEVILPEIDCEFLPSWVSYFVYAVSCHYQVPVGVAIMLTLAVIATSLQKKFVVSPFKDNSLIEPLNIWALAVTDNGHKRLILDALSKPIVDKETLLVEDLQLNIGNDSIQDFHKATIRCLVNKAARAEVEALIDPRNEDARSNHKRAYDLVCEASRVKDKMPLPIKSSKMIITNDITKRNLRLKLAEHSGKLAIISDDSNLLKCMQSPDFLHTYSGGQLRVKVDDRHIDLNHIALTVGLIVPAEALEGLKGKRHPYVKEVAAKILYCVEDPTVGRRIVINREAIPKEARLAYEAGVELMLNLQPQFTFDEITGENLPRLIRLSDQALELWLQFAKELDSELGHNGKFEALIRGWIENLPGLVLRIAGLVHITKLVGQYLDLIMSLPEDQRLELVATRTSSPLSPFSSENLPNSLIIERETMEKVIALCKDLTAHTKAAYDLLEVDEAMNDVQYVLDWLYKHFEVDENGAIFIRQHKLHRDSHFRKSSVTRIIKVLDQLYGQNILSPLVKLPTRKPTYIRYVNPAILKPRVKEKIKLITGNSTLLPYAQAS